METKTELAKKINECTHEFILEKHQLKGFFGGDRLHVIIFCRHCGKMTEKYTV